MRALLLASALALSTNLFAQALQVQDSSQVATALQVQRLAPQLVAFAGGDANFQNLVNGLATGAPVTLVSGTESVTFTPSTTMTPSDIAQTLEKLRQQLIGRGIATPTAQQLATALAGGTLPTAAGPTQVNGAVSVNGAVTTQQSPAVSIQQRMGAAATGSAASGGSIRSNVSDSPFPRGISDTPQAATPGVTTGASVGPSTAAMPGAATTTTTTPAGAGNTPTQAAIRVR